jgi:putative ABC transport system permease protein
MWRLALRDLQWRRRRFVIAVLATSLVFGMTLLMTGFSGSLHNEGPRIVAAVGADAWPTGRPGPSRPRPRSGPPRRSGSPSSPASCGPTRW